MFLDEKATPEQPPTQTVSQTFLAAAAYIERHGWCQYEVELPDGRVCLFGALSKVTSCLEDRHRAALRMNKHLGCTIQHWNDYVARSAGDVISLLREAASHHESG